MQGRIDHQISRNNFVKTEISVVDRKIKEIKELELTRSRLINRMQVIQNLQESRPQIVHLVDELVETIPDGAYLVSLVQRGKALTINGQAQSNARVSSYMRNIDNSVWIGRSNLKIIQDDKKLSVPGMSHFRMVAKQLNPAATIKK
jgi:type IV pilus assembly protein PilN